MKGRLHQAAPAKPIVAVGGEQAQAHKLFEDVVEKSVAPVVAVVVLQDLLEVIGMAPREGIYAGETQPDHVAVLRRGVVVQAQHVLPRLRQHAPKEMASRARRPRQLA
jgi:hypothetical protein